MRRVLCLLMVLAASAGSAAAAPDRRLAILEALFKDPDHASFELTPAFAAAASAEQVRAIVAGLEQENGAFQSAAADGGGFTIHLARADVAAKMALDWQGRIAGLRFTGVVPTGATIDSVVGTIRSLPGQVSLLVLVTARSAHRSSRTRRSRSGPPSSSSSCAAWPMPSVRIGSRGIRSSASIPHGARCRRAFCKPGRPARRSPSRRLRMP
jgi:hypothetical protein